jgi:hypothetical protein
LLDRNQTVKKERIFVYAAAVALVLLRSVVPLRYEGYFFDSDQAIVGLMAKHMSSFQRFPLFFYGQNYMLGVQAWIIAPMFWIVRPSVAAMRAPLVLLNCAVAIWLIGALNRRLGLRPLVALAAVLPFIIPTPAVAARLLEAQGSCVEPFVYILLLWQLRQRPFAFGAVLAFGFLHREFTIFAAPALAIVEAYSGELWSYANARRAGWIAAGFGTLWLCVNSLKLYLAGATLGLQVAMLGGQLCLDLHDMVGRASSAVTRALPLLYGWTAVKLEDLSINSPVSTGSAIVGCLGVFAMLTMALRLVSAWRREGRLDAADGFPMYLVLIGVFAVCAYPLSCAVVPGLPPLLRYLLLALLIPVGCYSAFMRRESSLPLRAGVTGVFVLWAAANAVDNVRLIRASAIEAPPNEHRVLANYLVSHHIEYARAIYWDAYAIDFLSQERVIVASTDIARIPEYQERVERHRATAVTLDRLPCQGGEKVASWCVQSP